MDFKASELNQLIEYSCEQVCEIAACYLKVLKTIIIHVYRSSDPKNIDLFLQKMENILDCTQTFNSDIVIFLVGDFNVHFNNKNDSIHKMSPSYL